MKIKCNCVKCGKEIIKDTSQIKNNKNGNVFCSKSCACSYNNSLLRTGKNHPNWIDGTYKTQNYSKKAFRTYEHKCAICNFDKVHALEVHHIDGNRNNDDINNLIIICANCHSLIHYGDLILTEEIKQNRKNIS